MELFPLHPLPVMPILERILWGLAILAVVMKSGHLPMSALLLVLSLGLLANMYLFLGWRLFPAPTGTVQLTVLSAASGLMLAVATSAILFKLQFWTGREAMLGLSILGLSILVLTLLVMRARRSDLRTYIRGLALRMLPLIALCTMLLATPDAQVDAFYGRPVNAGTSATALP